MMPAIAIGLLAIHLPSINVAAAGPLVAAWLNHRDGDHDRELSRRLARWSLAAFAVGATLGTLLLVAPNPGLRAALARFPASTYWFAGSELVFSAICMGIFAAGGRVWQRRPKLGWLVAAASASNLLYHFPPLMAVIGKLANDPTWASEEIISHKTQLGLSLRPEVLALWIHVVLASVATAAIAALWRRRKDSENGEHATDVTGTARWLGGIALLASLLQLPVGAWVLVTSETPAREALMGNDALTSALFVAGLVAALGLMHCLAAIALGDATPTMCRRSCWLVVTVAVLMTATLTLSRRGNSEEHHASAASGAASTTGGINGPSFGETRQQ